VNEAVFDELPDDARHFIAIQLDNDALNLNLVHVFFPSTVPGSQAPTSVLVSGDISLHKDISPWSPISS